MPFLKRKIQCLLSWQKIVFRSDLNEDDYYALVHKLVTGGQEGEFEDKLCVPIEMAKCVAKMYYELGQMDDSFIWK